MSEHKQEVSETPSDPTILLKLEDLINLAMGAHGNNVVNFKLVQTVLMILARQMRLLDQQVEIRNHVDPDDNPGTVQHQDKHGGTGQHEDSERGTGQHEVKESGAVQHDDQERRREEKTDNLVVSEDEKVRISGKDRGDDVVSASRKPDKSGKAQHEHTKSIKSTKSDTKAKENKPVKASPGRQEHHTAAKGNRPGKTGDEVVHFTKKQQKDTEKSEPAAMSVTEREGPGNEKIFVVERAAAPPAAASSKESLVGHVGSIAVVSAAQFQRLQAVVEALAAKAGPLPLPAVVEALAAKAGPLPLPALPDNQQLRTQLARGNASLSDTMHAMQLWARVSAAEEAISHVAGMLTSLAMQSGAGGLPSELPHSAAAAAPAQLQDEVERVRGEIQGDGGKDTASITASIASRRSAASKRSALAPLEAEGRVEGSAHYTGGGAGGVERQGGAGRARAAAGAGAPPDAVTKGEFHEAMKQLRNELISNMSSVAAKAGYAADNANALAKTVAERMDVALKLNSRVNALYALLADYHDQLAGFDSGLTSQMLGFHEQMTQLRGELNAGLLQLSNVTSNAETAAVLELTERYNMVVGELDHIIHEHSVLTDYQRTLSDQLKSLLQCAESLGEQKADIEEVMDGLRDKMELSRLRGLVTEDDFLEAHEDIMSKLDLCHQKFRLQGEAWKRALKELTAESCTKAEVYEVSALRDEAEAALQRLDRQLREVVQLLGEPKALVLCRKLSVDGTCGVCRVPAVMGPAVDGGPAPRPAWGAREATGTGSEAAGPDGQAAVTELLGQCDRGQQGDTHQQQVHWCRRYCGGSHTLRSEVARARMPAIAPVRPATRAMEAGTNGKIYHVEQPLVACKQCNVSLSRSDTDCSAAREQDSLPGGADAQGAGDSAGYRRVDAPPPPARPLGGDIAPPAQAEDHHIPHIAKEMVGSREEEAAARVAILHEIQRGSIVGPAHNTPPQPPHTD